MPLPKPNLDDRTFQQLVDEAKRAIPRYSPQWTDHNVSDPGVTLIELFAHMVETLIYRLNRVPEKSYITFLELMGVQLEPPSAARADLTFRLTRPVTPQSDGPTIIPRETEVSTIQTAAEPAINFSTDADLIVNPPILHACLTSSDGQRFVDQTRSLAINNESFPAFDPVEPRPGQAFYLCFQENLSSHILEIELDIREITGISIDPKNPPLAWEARCREGIDSEVWLEAEVESDLTEGLNKHGMVVMHLPARMVRSEMGGQSGYWLRCRHVVRGDQARYSSSPKIYALQLACWGGTVSAAHATVFSHEVLGRSDGLPGQIFHLENTPVLPRIPQLEVIEVQHSEGHWEPWSEVEHFGGSLPRDMHVHIDSANGQVSFGPIVRERDGSERQYGAVPPLGSSIRMRSYRAGGGAVGNVGARRISVPKSALPYVDQVYNRKPAAGGRDAESLEHAQVRAPQILRTSYRAVTAEDYEYLAKEATRGIHRVRCIQPGMAGGAGLPAGRVRVLLVPSVANPEGPIRPEQLRPGEGLRREVQKFLDQRRLLTTSLEIDAPSYTVVTVQARVRTRTEADPERVRDEALARLYRFLNPIVGGYEGQGWPFGRDLYISEIFALLQGVAGIEFVEAAQITVEGQRQAQVSLPPDGLIVSGEHYIEIPGLSQ